METLPQVIHQWEGGMLAKYSARALRVRRLPLVALKRLDGGVAMTCAELGLK